jgi:hypothetical protein
MAQRREAPLGSKLASPLAHASYRPVCLAHAKCFSFEAAVIPPREPAIPGPEAQDPSLLGA